jgi:formamidopyrimidine-DNA glycosylase
MPELPEVEHTARQLRASVVGATIREALVFWERTIGHPDLPDFLAEIAERTIIGVRRRGKFLILDLKGAGSTDLKEAGRPQGAAHPGDDEAPLPRDVLCDHPDLMLTIHRRMTGNLLLLPPGWEIDTSLKETDPAAWNTKGPTFRNRNISDQDYVLYCRVCFNLMDGRRLLFNDQRKFGRIELWPREQEVEALEGLGIEPLSDEFTVERLQEALAGRKAPIKQVLLAQEVIAGLGNIYADEALFYAKIHPLRRADSLTASDVQQLHEGVVSVLTGGIEHGGTSFSNYRDLVGEAGDNYSHMLVYHQHAKPCSRCGILIERITVAQRSTHFCPGCQKLIGE